MTAPSLGAAICCLARRATFGPAAILETGGVSSAEPPCGGMERSFMLDGVSLDQLRTFIAAVDEGSFSAAARRLNRVQSAVSGWVGALEDQIGVTLFDRSGRFPN